MYFTFASVLIIPQLQQNTNQTGTNTFKHYCSGSATHLLCMAFLSSRKISLVLLCSGCDTVRRAYRRCTSHSILFRFRGLCRYSWNFSEPKYSRSVSSRIVASFCESSNRRRVQSHHYNYYSYKAV